MKPLLILLSGLPGTGKSALAHALARTLVAPMFSVDPIESAILSAGMQQGFATGFAAYAVAQRLADDHLSLGQTVIADAVNFVEEAREAWRRIAAERGVPLVVIECVCSDPGAHRERIERRERGLHPSFREPSWQDVQRRADEYRPWPEDVLVIDSALPLADNVARVLERVTSISR